MRLKSEPEHDFDVEFLIIEKLCTEEYCSASEDIIA